MIGPMDSPERLWRTQFNRQLTVKMMECVVKQTIALVRRIERRTPWRDQLGADDRLQAAILATLEGSPRWDPERVDLGRFLFGVIAGAISHELRHLARFPQASLDDETQHLDALERETSEALEETRASKNEVPKQVWWSAFIAQIRARAEGDRGVLALLHAYEAGHLARRDVMTFLGMSARLYRTSYARLVQLADEIDDDVRALVMQAIA